MDCVGCDRCRMWGKIQTIGYGTALKILFEDDENNQSNLKFRRIEIVALINTFDRLSKSIAIINNFKQMYIQHLQDVVEGKAQPGQFNNNEKTLGQGFHFPFVNSLPKQPQTSKQQNHQPHSSLHKQSNSDSTSSRSSTHQQSPPQQKKSIFEIYEIPTRNRTFNQELKLAFYEVWEALKFVLGSYKEFPVVIGKVSLGYLNNLWNNLIGKPAGVREEYRSPLNVDNAVGDEHQQYLNLINEED